MFGVIMFFVVQVFLFGFTRAQCESTCSPCKEISAPADPKYIGNWSLENPTSSRCDWNISCLYRRDGDGAEMCFCDPGPIVYEECDRNCYETNIDFYGNDVDPDNGKTTESPSECQAICQQTEGCLFFTWHVPGNNCWLKSKPNRTISEGHISGPRSCEFKGGLCYNYTGVDGWDPTSRANNDVATCDKYCLDNPPSSGLNTFFQLGSTNLDQGKLCGCSQTEPSPYLVVDPSYCDIPCTGRNSTQTCGGFNDGNNHRYVNIWPTFPNPTATDGACYNSTGSSTPLGDPTFLGIEPGNDVETCNTYNQGLWPSFTYFALGSSILNDGSECYAGFSEPSAAQLVSPYYCSGTPCPGNNDQECGYYQNWNNERFINVWRRIN